MGPRRRRREKRRLPDRPHPPCTNSLSLRCKCPIVSRARISSPSEALFRSPPLSAAKVNPPPPPLPPTSPILTQGRGEDGGGRAVGLRADVAGPARVRIRRPGRAGSAGFITRRGFRLAPPPGGPRSSDRRRRLI